jgi:hypothetical protein
MKHEVSTSNSSACAVALCRVHYSIHSPRISAYYWWGVDTPCTRTLYVNTVGQSHKYPHNRDLLHDVILTLEYDIRV